MNEAGVLGKLIPDFGKIVAMMQFNMYHHYTVDEHLLRCIGVLSEIERGDGERVHPLSHKLIAGLKNRREVLYVAVLLHDIAKGRPDDHSEAGAKIARRICPHMGLSAADTETVAWLVENHLADVDDGADARPERSQDHRGLRRCRAIGRAAEAASDPDRLRHPRRWTGRLERLEGSAAAHALLRDRTAPHRRVLRSIARRAHGGGAPSAGRRHWPAGRKRIASAMSACTTTTIC